MLIPGEDFISGPPEGGALPRLFVAKRGCNPGLIVPRKALSGKRLSLRAFALGG